MVRRNIRKLVIRLGVFDRIKALKYKGLTQLLNIRDGFVYHTHQVEFMNGELVATGDDPQILICFNQPTSAISIDSVGCDDEIEVFPSEDGILFTEKLKKTIERNSDDSEKVDGGEIVPFGRPYKFFRVDLAKHAGRIKTGNISIAPNGFSGDEFDLMLDNIPDSKVNGYVVVTHAMDGTGAPLLALNICKALKERGVGVVVLALTGGLLEKEYRRCQIPVFNLYQGAIKQRIEKGEELELFARKMNEKGYCNLLVNTTISGIVAPYFKNYNYKIVSLIHEMKNSIEKYEMEDGGRNSNFYADYMVFPDKIVRDEFDEVFDNTSNKAIVLPQGFYKKYEKITPNKRVICKNYNIPYNAKIIFGSGPASFRKGIDLFLEAAEYLVRREGKGEEYHFIWTGDYVDDELKNWFEYQLKKVGLSARVHMIKFIKDAKIYQNMVECADAFWLTSREDPFPSVMIEALMFGTPVIAFRGCGGADTLLSGGRGILVDAFDTDRLVEETLGLINDSAKVGIMISKAKKYIQKHLDFDLYVDKLMGYFEKDMSDKFADVSVVIPNYNYEKYLPMRIMSIANQTVRPREILLLDDNSKDNSLTIAKPLLEFVKKEYGIKYKIVKNDNNQGCFKQWIKGFKQASYDYVWIAEADDYIRPNFIETLLPSFRDEKVVLAYCKSCVINGESVALRYDYNSYLNDLDEKRWKNDFVCDGREFVVNYLSQKNVIPNASSTIIRRSATVGIEKYLADYKAIGDWFAYIYVIAQGKVSYCASILNGHRRHEKSIIARQEKSKQFVKEMMKIKYYLIENYDYNDKDLNKLMVSLLNENFDINKVCSDKELGIVYQKLVNLYRQKRVQDNLLIVLPDLEVGGGQAVGIRFANYFTKYYNVFILSAREYLETKYMKRMINDEVEILTYGGDIEKAKFFNTTLGFKAVLSLIWWSDKLSYLAFSDTNVKRIISMHGCYENILEHPDIDPFFEGNVERMLTTADYVVYTAEKNKKIFEAKKIFLGDKLTKIDNGFLLGDYPTKTRDELGIGEDDFVFGLVARGIPEKGYEQAINGINYVNAKIGKKKCHLIMLGSGGYIDELKNENDSEYIHFIDNTTEPLEWIGWEKIFDVGLLPSFFKSESMPTAIVEMLFLGKPIIATDIGEIKSMIIGDGIEAGVVISLKNGKPNQEELNDAMLKMVSDGERLRIYGNNAKKMSERFDMNKCIKKYRELIEN